MLQRGSGRLPFNLRENWYDDTTVEEFIHPIVLSSHLKKDMWVELMGSSGSVLIVTFPPNYFHFLLHSIKS